MSVFTAEDVADVAAVGNAAHNAIYLARFQNKEFIPNGSDILKLREFIKSKYNDKKWYANGSKGTSNDRDRSSGSQIASDSGDLWGKKQSSASKSSPMIKVGVHDLLCITQGRGHNVYYLLSTSQY